MIKTELPKQSGERLFANNILKYLDTDDFWFWFNVQIPKSGMSKEVDALIYSKKHKIFIVVEVKGYLVENIKIINKQNVVLSDGKSMVNPWFQVSDNAKKFSSVVKYLLRTKQFNTTKKIFFSPIVAFPNMSRRDFYDYLKNESSTDIYLKEMTNSTFFEEDFINKDILLERITYSLQNPIYGICFFNNKEDNQLNDKELESFSKVLFPEYKNKYNKTYDSKVLRELEKECLKILAEIKPTHKVLIEGYAGTGKTFIGFNLARKLAEQGNKVLFTCYNKTLATDLRRIKTNEPVFRNTPGVQRNLFVKDIFEILVDLNRIFPNQDNVYTTYIEKRKFKENDSNENIDLKNKINKSENKEELTEYDKWAIEIIDKILIKNGMHDHLYKYDYIIADETQDFKGYMFDLLDLLVDKSKNLTYIFGKKQVLYQNDEIPEYNDLQDIRSILKSERKENYIERRRVFRTTDISFLVAQSYLECFPRVSNAIDFISDNYRRKEDDNLTFDFEFERKGGSLPKMIYSDGNNDDLLSKLTKALTEIFNRNKELNGVDSDIMILIPHYDYIKTPILKVLDKLGKKHIDYTLDINKRIEFSDDEVRICSYYSARGLEANFVLIIGFNYFEIPIIERKKDYIINDLGYIVLSRAIYDTYLLSISEKKERQLEFLEEIVKHFKN